MKKQTLILTLILFTIICGGLVFVEPTLAQTTARIAPKLIEPSLQVDIPDVVFSKATFKDGILNINHLGDYIAGIYKYLLGISTTIAIVFIMVGGLQYAFGGVSEASVTKAKTRIFNSIIGLVLLMSTYLILYIVNPNLVSLKFPELENIDYESLLVDSGDNSGYTNWTDLEVKLSDMNITCASAGESLDLSLTANAFVGKVTYRFGAKGGDPQYTGEQSRQVGGEYTYNFCPEGTICADCSGFADILRQCAGLPSLGETGGTKNIFSQAERIVECDKSYIFTEEESFELADGDLVGYKAGDRPDQPDYGHVWMYIGDGKVISAMGGGPGRIAGNAIQIQDLNSICTKYPLRYLPRSQ